MTAAEESATSGAGSSSGPDASTARDDTDSLRDRFRRYPRPAALWATVFAALVVVEAGAVFQFAASFTLDAVRTFNGIEAVAFTIGTGGIEAAETAAAQIPTLLSKETIPNNGYYSTASEEWIVGPVYYDGQQWVGTFSALDPVLAPLSALLGIDYDGFSPAAAWGLRVVLVYAYSFAFLAWLWTGAKWYRRYYRIADWTPRDDVVDRLRTHYWGLFGLVVVLCFLTIVVFGPTLAPTTNAVNNVNPYSYQIQYWDAEAGEVASTLVGAANRQAASKGSTNVGPMSYDRFGRFHPFGTMPSGQDLFTFVMWGARLSLIIGLIAIGLSTLVATASALVSAYYKGWVDLGTVLISDAVMALPGLLLLIMLSVLLGNTWIANIYDGGILLALIFAGTGWPALWRSIRGPALQTAERGWVDAARSFGQRPTTIMRKHMLPYVTGYLLVYGSMSLGGAIIGIAGLSYLGLGVNPPTPEWGRAISMGQRYIGTASWHISIIPGILITIVVIGFNALGDGIRDAIDPQSDAEAADDAGVGRGGGA